MRLTRKDIWGVLLLGISVLAVIGFLIYPNLHKKPMVGEDLCVEGQPIGRHHIFIIDQSDPVPQRNIDQLRLIFDRMLREMGINDRISIYTINDTSSPFSKENRSICNPGRGADANPYTANPQRIEVAFKTHFLKPLQQALSQETFNQKSHLSPLMEFFQDVTRAQEYLPKAESQVYYIVSDFLQHSPLLNHYQGLVALADLLRQDAMVFHQPDFKGSEVNLIYIVRPEHKLNQSSTHKKFWRDYFQHFKAGRVNLL